MTIPRGQQHSQTGRENYTLCGLLLYVTLIPVLTAFFAAPRLVIGFTLGGISAIGVSYLHARYCGVKSSDSD